MNDLETFYVYRSLHSDESWGALLADAPIYKLPNIDFGMIVYAENRKQAISRARDLYEKIHANDSDRKNIREFSTCVLGAVSRAMLKNGGSFDGKEEKITKSALNIAIKMNEAFNEYFFENEKRKAEDAKATVTQEGLGFNDHD